MFVIEGKNGQVVHSAYASDEYFQREPHVEIHIRFNGKFMEMRADLGMAKAMAKMFAHLAEEITRSLEAIEAKRLKNADGLGHQGRPAR